MIFYKHPKKQRAVEEKNIVFSIFDNGVVSGVDDAVTKPVECKTFYNLSYQDGALKSGLGFRDLQVPDAYENPTGYHGFNFAEKIDEIDGMWMVRLFNNTYGQYYYQLFMIDSAFKLWGVPMVDEYEGHVWTRSEHLKSYPTYHCSYRIENEDSSMFFSEEGMLCFANRENKFYSNVPALISCVVHYDNFFGITNTNRNTLIYTKNLNLKTWDESESSAIEFLDNRGSFTKLVTFNDYVYLFREYGITKISIYSSQSDFSFTHLYTSSSKIFEESVCVCGDKVLFMTRDGLYSFNGNSVERVAQNCDVYFKNLDNSFATAACLEGKYYIATKCNFNDGQTVGCEDGEFVNNVLFEVDIDTFALNLYRGVDIRKVLAIDNPYFSKLCACFNHQHKQRVGELTTSGATFEDATQKCWKSFSTDLGFKAKRKRIKEISLFTQHPIVFEICSDEETKSFEIDGSDKEQKINVCVTGTTFQFVFSTKNANCDVKKPMIVFDVAK